MVADLNALLGQASALSEAPYAALAWQAIQEKPSSVAFKTASGGAVAAQTVRVEADSSASPSESAAGMAARRKVVLFGIKGHATLTDTDFEAGYRFVLDGAEYRIVDVNDRLLGERQATAEKNG